MGSHRSKNMSDSSFGLGRSRGAESMADYDMEIERPGSFTSRQDSAPRGGQSAPSTSHMSVASNSQRLVEHRNSSAGGAGSGAAQRAPLPYRNVPDVDDRGVPRSIRGQRNN